MRKFIIAFVITFSIVFGLSAADKSWKSVASEMKVIIDDAY